MGESSEETHPDDAKLPARLQHLTWAWYTFPMSTGGLALLLSPSTQPHTFQGLEIIAKIVYIFDLVIFTLITCAMLYRFTQQPSLLRESIFHPTEGLFMPTIFLSLASIIGGTKLYGIPSSGPWLVVAYRVLFWIYFAVTFLVAIGMYYVLFCHPSLKVDDMTPAWDLPIFPVMLTGTIAAIGASSQPTEQAVPIIVAGVLSQGLGMIVSVLMYACYIRRMIQFGFPSPTSRPAMFIAVGPPAFTSLALIGMAEAWPEDANYFGTDGASLRVVLLILATMSSLFIIGAAFWFFFIALLATCAVGKELTFHLNWWAFIFPNVGLTISVIRIGNQFGSEGVLWVGSTMTMLLVAAYLFILVMNIKAVLNKEILFKDKDEDTYIKEGRSKVM
ncbi:transmembrane transport [Ascochyta rabiei]|uniref:Transmembrane transport n=1 Tax=Didymella rabiei TaxID=5454 RepID=A0A163F0P1_DIDRA|nr:transmembrane transport [Ascochyta rabiei]